MTFCMSKKAYKGKKHMQRSIESIYKKLYEQGSNLPRGVVAKEAKGKGTMAHSKIEIVGVFGNFTASQKNHRL